METTGPKRVRNRTNLYKVDADALNAQEVVDYIREAIYGLDPLYRKRRKLTEGEQMANHYVLYMGDGNRRVSVFNRGVE